MASKHLRAKAAELRAENKQAAEHRRFKRGPFDFRIDERRAMLIEVYETVADAIDTTTPARGGGE